MRAAGVLRQSGAVRPALLLAAAVAALVVAERTLFEAPADPFPKAPAATAPIPFPADYGTALAAIDRGLVSARERAARRPGEWLAWESLARAELDRARLTGDFDDYAAAQAALDRAFAAAPEGAGPHLLQATLDFSMHRLGRAEARLDAVARDAVIDPGEQAEIAAMRGDIAFYRGDFDGALARYDEADRLRPGTAEFRRTVFHSLTGDLARAEAHIGRAEQADGRPHAPLAAWMEMQRGILDLDHGRTAEARAHFERADGIFPGYWLIEEHLAETMALQGELGAAEARYRDIVARTGAPEFMDALADLAARRGDAEAERRWRAQARAEWRRRLGQFPEAAYGHGVDHCLAARDWACAVVLARRNLAARPYGEARVMLAEALLGAGRRAEAERLLDQVLATRWRSGRTMALAEALGRSPG